MAKDVEFIPCGEHGGMSVYGNEVHVVGDKRGWINRKLMREIFVPLIKKHGALITRMPKDDPTGHKFLKRLGFEKTGEEGIDVLYRIERCNYE